MNPSTPDVLDRLDDVVHRLEQLVDRLEADLTKQQGES